MSASAVHLAVDVVALTTIDRELRVAAISREDTPGTPTLALPGVLVRVGERIEDAATRALAKITPQDGIESYTLTGQILPIMDQADRDHRSPSLSVPVAAFITYTDTDAAREATVPVDRINAFDHHSIVTAAAPVIAARAYSSREGTTWAGMLMDSIPGEKTTRNFGSAIRSMAAPDQTINSPNLGRALRAAGMVAGKDGWTC